MLELITLISVLSTVQAVLFTVPSYFDVSLQRCDGMFSSELFGLITFNKSASNFIEEIPTTDKDACRWTCSREKTDCWMIEYLPSSCRLYRTASYEMGGQDYLETWKCSEPQCASFPNRCVGFWVGYDNYKVNNIDEVTVKTIVNITKSECQSTCANHPMCGSILFRCYDKMTCQYSNGNCTILFRYLPFINKATDFEKGVHSISIRCWFNENMFEESLINERFIGSDSEKVSGKWNLVKYQNHLKFDLSQLSNIIYSDFPCLSFKTCIETCSKEPFCTTPIFMNTPQPICYLVMDSSIENFTLFRSLVNRINNSVSIIWEWETKSNQSEKIPNENKNVSCVCFDINRTLNIKRELCLNYETITVKSALNLYLKKNSSLKEESRVDQVLTMMNGDQKYLVKIDGIRKNEYCESFFCDTFHRMPPESSIFVGRSEWMAAPPLERNLLKHPAEMIVILNTYKPNNRCFSRVLCSRFVRKIQKFHMNKIYSDIAYNFLIGEDGLIYEGRGWKYVGAHTKSYNSKSIGVAFIGWFEYVKPNSKSLLALRTLIQYGISKKYLRPNPIITNHRSLRNTQIPGRKLTEIIKNWEMIDLSKIWICVDKHIIKKIIIIAVPIFIVSTVLILAVVLYQRRIHNNRVCRNIDAKLRSTNMTQDWVFDHFSDRDINVERDLIYFCEERNSSNETCNCFVHFKALWWFCVLKSGRISYSNCLKKLFANMSCSNATSIYVEVPNRNASHKIILYFHFKESLTERHEDYFLDLTRDERCICRKLSVRPVYSRKDPKAHRSLLDMSEIIT